jgi:hypothetical protein
VKIDQLRVLNIVNLTGSPQGIGVGFNRRRLGLDRFHFDNFIVLADYI